MPPADAEPANLTGDALGSLLRATHLLAPDQLAAAAVEHAGRFGARELVMYLIDYEQAMLHPLPGPGAEGREPLSVEGSAAGLAFRRVEVIAAPAQNGERRLWLPLQDGVERLGVVELLGPADDARLEEAARAFVSLLAELLVVNDAYRDVFAQVRRRRPLTVAAESNGTCCHR